MNKFKLRLLLLLLIAAICMLHSFKAVSQAKEEFDNLVFFIPQGFTVNKSTNSLILTDATAASGQSFSITINKSIYSLKKIEKSFPVFWKESLAMDGFDNPEVEPQFVKFSNNSGWNCFRGGKTVRYSASSTPSYYHLTVVKYLGITTRIITRASSEDLFVQKIPQLMQLVASIDFKKNPPPQNVYAGAPASTPPSNGGYSNPGSSNTGVSVQTNTLYMSVQGDLLSSAVEISILYFLPDGSVYIDIPEKGFSNFNVQDQKARSPETFGTYTSSGNNIIVKMNGEANGVTYTTRPDGGLQSSNNAGLVFRKIEGLDNYRFDGTYIKKQENNGITITFSKDGRFTENGLIKTLAPNYNGSNVPGNGNYSVTQNSVLLQYADGHSLQLCMYMMPEDYQQGDRPSKILINNYVLTKQ